MLILKGETRVDYFHLLCKDCGKHVSVTGLDWDNGVPQITAECSDCEETGSFKLLPTWAAVVPRR